MEPREVSHCLEVIDEQAMPEELDAALRRLLCACFPDDTDVYAHTRAWHTSIPAWSVVARCSEEPVGQVSIFVRTIACEADPLTVAGVGNFCVAPAWRGTGLSARLMERAMDEARSRGIEFGLLFCLPGLARLYGSFGWTKTAVAITMHDAAGCDGPLPAGNIAMLTELGPRPFPPGPIHLQGCDW